MSSIGEIIIKNKLNLGITLCLLYLLAGSASVSASSQLIISDEVGPSTVETRSEVETLDDQWQQAVIDSGIDPGTLENTTIPVDATDITELHPEVDVSLQNIVNPQDANDLGTPAATQGKAGSETSSSLQGNAPKPESLVDQAYFNEVSGSSQSRNGLLFTFGPDITAFGAYFGDVETRTDGQGEAAQIRLYDREDMLLSDDILHTSTADQSLCGAPVDDGFAGCGNNTTRWIGFVDPAGNVGRMLVIVGDDDTTETSADGNSEHLSFTGATIATGIVIMEEPESADTSESAEDIADTTDNNMPSDIPNSETSMIANEPINPAFDDETYTPVVVTLPTDPELLPADIQATTAQTQAETITSSTNSPETNDTPSAASQSTGSEVDTNTAVLGTADSTELARTGAFASPTAHIATSLTISALALLTNSSKSVIARLKHYLSVQ